MQYLYLTKVFRHDVCCRKSKNQLKVLLTRKKGGIEKGVGFVYVDNE